MPLQSCYNIYRQIALLLFILLFGVLLLPAPLHFRVCLPDGECVQPVAIEGCHDQQQHTVKTANELAGGHGDCHHLPVGCGRSGNYLRSLKAGGDKLRTRIIIPFLGNIIAFQQKLCEPSSYSQSQYFQQHPFPARNKLLELSSIVIRC